MSKSRCAGKGGREGVTAEEQKYRHLDCMCLFKHTYVYYICLYCVTYLYMYVALQRIIVMCCVRLPDWWSL